MAYKPFCEFMKQVKLIFLAICFIAVASCGSYKRTTYLQDMDTETTYLVQTPPDTKIRVDDILNIYVSCKSPALAAPFNVMTGHQKVDPISNETSYDVSPGEPRGYLVDKNGNINFPVLGMLHVEGMTLPEVRRWISDMIIKGEYIREPIITAEFVNFQFTMLGEIGAGNYVVPSGNINIFQALAMAGDLGPDAQRKDVWVIRTEAGTRKVYSLDMTSKSVYDSPAFYLQQNDMVYVKPYKTKIDSKIQNLYAAVSMGMAGLSLIATVMVWLKL